ncbi:MAG: peptidase [Acidobacteria bacterium]|nr:peptidase [Acidobacteriota bacterium]
MTYCVAMNVEDGIVGLSDTLITSGREVTTLRKVNVYSPPRGTFFVMTSGLRSLRDKTLTYFEDRLAERASRDEPFERLYQAVNLLAEQVRAVAHEDKAALHESGMAFNIHALIGGQMERDAHQKLYLLYPEGNWVDTGRLTPYHVIGSVGYGKPLLDRTLRVEDSMRHAFKVACLSFDSTRISAADVDFPIDVVLYRRNSFRIIERRFQKQDLEQLSRWWGERIRHAIEETPRELLDRAYDEIETAPPAPISTVS